MLGDLSAKYESNSDPGAISDGWGDAGGKSYGAHQYSSATGVVYDFVAWLVRQGYGPADDLLQSSNSTFDDTWRGIAAQDPEGFLAMQHLFTRGVYYDPAVKALSEAGFNADRHSCAMQEVIYSRAVQYGPSLIVEMFESAAQALGNPDLSYIDDAAFDHDMIRAVYIDVCMTEEWTSSSPALRAGLYARFESECTDALAMLDAEVV